MMFFPSHLSKDLNMPLFIVKAMLQEVESEEIYNDFDQAMAAEGGYAYTTGADNKIYALPPDEFEFDVEETADSLLKIVKLICDQTEKKHKLPRTPIVIVEPKVIRFANLEEYTEDDEDDLDEN